MILSRLKIPGALLAALLFAVHPVNVATVAWISEQKNTLSASFYGVSILLYLRFDEEKRWQWYGLSLAAFLLALLSKTSVVMLPVVLLLCVLWRQRKVLVKDIIYFVPFFLLSLVLGLVTVWFQYHHVMRELPVRTDTFIARLVIAGRIIWFYLFKAFVPWNLTVNYPNWKIETSDMFSYLPLIGVISCLAVFWWKRKTWGAPWLLAFGYFVITLFPVSGFMDQGFFRYSHVADHWQYLAILAPIAFTVASILRICGQNWRTQTFAGIVLLLFSYATWGRALTYKSDETLWKDTLIKNSSSWLAHTNLGEASLRSGNTREAYLHYETALRINPNYAPAHYDLGLLLWQSSRKQLAVDHWQQALRLEPNLSDAHYTLGVAMMTDGKTNEAIQQWQETVRIDPNDAEAQNDLGSALLTVGKLREAIDHYECAVRIRPDYAQAHFNLAFAWERAGRVSEAINQYWQTTQLDPNMIEAQRRLERLRASQ